MKLAPISGLVVFALLCYSGVHAGVTKCYTCAGKCDNPTEQNCEQLFGTKGDYVCTTAKDPNGNEYKTCLASAGVDLYCDVFNLAGGSCDSCDSDLCNNSVMSSPSTPSPAIITTPSSAELYSASVLGASILVFLVAKFI